MLNNRVRLNLLSYGLLLPAFLVSVSLILFPLFVTIDYSFKPSATMNIIGNLDVQYSLDGYRRVIFDIETWRSLLRSFIYMLGSLFPSYVIGLCTAILLNRNFSGRRACRTLIILPWAIPGVVASIMFIWMFDSSFGVINYFLASIGIIESYKQWFFDPSLVMFSVILPTIWKGYPFFTIALLAALQSIPSDLYEAAEVDGCGFLRKLIYVTWPGIKSTSILALILNGLWSFRQFDIIYATTRGGPSRATTTLAIQIYNEAFRYFDINKASVLGVLAFIVSAVIVLIFYPMMNKESDL
mgnify:CR=1 FL=1